MRPHTLQWNDVPHNGKVNGLSYPFSHDGNYHRGALFTAHLLDRFPQHHGLGLFAVHLDDSISSLDSNLVGR